MISLDNLTVSYGGWTLFDNISFLINPKDRIGLVGKNGAGKTTLLRIITGEQQPTSGAVTLNGDCTIGYLPQTMRVADTTTLAEETAKAFEEVLRLEAEIEALTREIAERTDYESPEYEQLLHRLNDAQDHYHILGGETRDADIEKTLLGLGFKRSDFGRATSEFSGGWRMRIELAKLLLQKPDLLLLDEPTNHLDIYMRESLTQALAAYTGTLLLVTHDRYLMQTLGCPIMYLEDGKATFYPSFAALQNRDAGKTQEQQKTEDTAKKQAYGKEQRKRRAEVRARLKKVESEIEELGAHIVELENEINDPEVLRDHLLLRDKCDELDDTRFHQQELYDEWEKLAEEQETFENEGE